MPGPMMDRYNPILIFAGAVNRAGIKCRCLAALVMPTLQDCLPGCGRLGGVVIVCCVIFLGNGCAVLPGGRAVPEDERLTVIHDFNGLVESRQGCLHQVDADISLRFESLLYRGKIDGYLLAMPDAFLRFEGINPLGLTELLLATDGKQFTLLSVRKQKAYSGPVTAEKFEEYAPPAFSDGFLFLLNGLLPFREPYAIREVEADEQGAGYWLMLYGQESAKVLKVHYQPKLATIDRILLFKDGERDAVRVTYTYAEPGATGVCPEPGLIEVDTQGSGLMTIHFSRRYPGSKLTRGQFLVAIPNNYTKVSVQ